MTDNKYCCDTGGSISCDVDDDDKHFPCTQFKVSRSGHGYTGWYRFPSAATSHPKVRYGSGIFTLQSNRWNQGIDRRVRAGVHGSNVNKFCGPNNNNNKYVCDNQGNSGISWKARLAYKWYGGSKIAIYSSMFKKWARDGGAGGVINFDRDDVNDDEKFTVEYVSGGDGVSDNKCMVRQCR